MTEILKVGRDIKKIVQRIAELIRQGKVLVCPTDTVYGFITDATNKGAVERLFKIKKRQKDKAFPIFVRDIETAKKLAQVDERTERFLKKVWPGKVTVILKLKGKSIKRKIYGVGKKTIGLRIPDYALIKLLLAKVNKPLTGTSANISGKPSSNKIREVIAQLRGQRILPDLILDAGNLKKAQPSTVIDLTKKKPKILRMGQRSPKLI